MVTMLKRYCKIRKDWTDLCNALQQIALFGKEGAVQDKQRSHNKTGKVTSAESGHQLGTQITL
jgi:hypothetical protein